MDSPTDRRGLEVLSPDECDALLGSSPLGRVSFISQGAPLILPVNYAYHEGAIVFRTTTGEKLAAAQRRDYLGFEIDAWDAVKRRGWSVVVRGKAEQVEDEDEVAELEALGVNSWANPGFKARWVRIRPEEISGRRLD